MNEDKVIHMLLDHEERLTRIEQNMVTKSDHREVMDTLDKIVTLMEKKDQELTMLARGERRQTDIMERHERDITRIKPLVGLV